MEATSKFEPLLLEHQLCFPFYVISKEIIRLYTPILEPLGITYTQYIVMMILWEYGEMSVKELGRRMFLDSGTLTPVIRKLESKGYITKKVNLDDERSKLIHLTKRGKDLKPKCSKIPEEIFSRIDISPKEMISLQKTLFSIVEKWHENQ